MKTILAVVLSFLLCIQIVCPVVAQDTKEETQTEDSGTDISAPSAILMEASTGQVIYDKAAEEQLPPASVTKVMTLLLIFDALESGKIKMEDKVSVSDYAASMGGSQVFFEPGEIQTVDTMIKCIAVASANDACVAMAEYISGSEEEFVNAMNERAKGLGMGQTTFKNCNGLDSEGHLTTAKDIALMSRALITTYPKIHEYSTIWMENITHTTKKGSTEFGLTNTNKLVRQYPYATGLKTGSTSKAKYCVSATAKKEDMELIAVIMAAPDYKVRFEDAEKLLNYGFAKCTKYEDNNPLKLSDVPVKHGVEPSIMVEMKEKFGYVDITGADLSKVEKKVELKKDMKAPVNAGDKVGKVHYYMGDKEIGSVDILAKYGVPEMTFESAAKETLASFLL